MTSLYQVKTGRKRYGRSGWSAFATLVMGLIIASAQPARPEPAIIADDLDRASLRAAIAHSIAYLRRLRPELILGTAPRRFTAAEVMATLEAFERTLSLWHCRQCWIDEVGARFDFLPSAPDPNLQSVLVTGYYQPTIDASLVPTADYRYPLYGRPADLVGVEEAPQSSGASSVTRIGRYEAGRLVPYYSRAEIDYGGSLRGQGYEIAWAKDPVDIFFLQIQGSGILQLPDGRRLQIGYAGQNGLPYRSIGRLLIEQGKIAREEMSMQRLRRYLAEHPEERDEIMAYNESYVFFRFLFGGPLGNLEVPVTPGRSIAADAALFPKGALALLYSERPVLDRAGNLLGWTPFLRFVLNQDTGGAIRGAQRVDLFFGAAGRAGSEAGYMNSPGKLYFLALKQPPRHTATP
jgi:membrane-bound lytic murein transglycosylase A